MSSDQKNRFPLVPVSCPADCDFDSNGPATYQFEAKLFSNVCIRSLNSIYYNAPRVKPGDEEVGLEKVIFPVLQKKYDMTPFIQRHASYEGRINALNEYLKTVAAKGPYDGQKVRELLDSFGTELVETFNEEVKTIDPERLREYDENEIKEMLQAHRALLQKLIEETPSPVFVITHHDLKTAPTWPAQAKYIGPVDELKVYIETQSYWKFAPFSVKNNGETQTYAL